MIIRTVCMLIVVVVLVVLLLSTELLKVSSRLDYSQASFPSLPLHTHTRTGYLSFVDDVMLLATHLLITSIQYTHTHTHTQN